MRIKAYPFRQQKLGGPRPYYHEIFSNLSSLALSRLSVSYKCARNRRSRGGTVHSLLDSKEYFLSLQKKTPSKKQGKIKLYTCHDCLSPQGISRPIINCLPWSLFLFRSGFSISTSLFIPIIFIILVLIIKMEATGLDIGRHPTVGRFIVIHSRTSAVISHQRFLIVIDRRRTTQTAKSEGLFYRSKCIRGSANGEKEYLYKWNTTECSIWIDTKVNL